jgi:hypothetical protein
MYSRYNINGHIDIQFDGIGLVKDIVLTGIVNSDGTINVSLTQSYQGFTVSGNLKGILKRRAREREATAPQQRNPPAQH